MFSTNNTKHIEKNFLNHLESIEKNHLNHLELDSL